MKKAIIFLSIIVMTVLLFFPSETRAASTVEQQLNQLNNDIQQIVIATTDKTSSRNATISYYQKKNGKWVKVYSRMSGLVGKNGLTSNKKEGDGKTPKGIYSLTSSFGYATKPSGVKLPYTKTNKYSYWIDDVTSSDYNKKVSYQGDPNKKWKSFERLTHHLYSHAVVIDYNTSPIVKGKGSAIFLHTRNSDTKYTLGCVAIYKDSLVKIMKQLDPKLNPHIIISEESNLNKTIADFAGKNGGDYFTPTTNIPVYKHMTGNTKVGTLYAGEVFPIIEDEFVNWYKVKIGSIYGYIKKEKTKRVATIDKSILNTIKEQSKSFTATSDLYVKTGTSGKQITIGIIEKGLSYPIVNESDSWYGIDFLGRIGYVWKPNTILNKGYFAPTKQVVVYKHMTGSATIGTLYKGESYPINEDKFANWYEVKVGGQLGYVKKHNTRFLINQSIPSLNKGQQNSSIKIKAISDLYVKESMNGKQITFGKINKGQTLPIISETDFWYQIDFLGRIGYVWKPNAVKI